MILYRFLIKNPFAGFDLRGYLRQSSDWPTHGLVCYSNESHGNLLHAHPLRGVARFVVPVCDNLRMKSNKNKEKRQENATFCFPVPAACDWLVDRKRLMSRLSWSKCFNVSSKESGSFSPGPKIFGKKEGRRRPRARLASVTVRGPPEKTQQRKGLKDNYTSYVNISKATFSVTSWSWMCTCRLWSNNKHPWSERKNRAVRWVRIVSILTFKLMRKNVFETSTSLLRWQIKRPEEESGPSTRSHGVDVQLRRLQRHPSRGRFEHVFVVAGVATYISGGSCSVGRKEEIQDHHYCVCIKWPTSF